MMPDPLSRKERVKIIKDAFIALMWIANRQLSHRLQAFGLTHSQFLTLAGLAAHKQPCPMRDLTILTMQDAPTMTGIVDRLVKMKLVQRTRSETDRRVVLVQATPDGIDLVSQIEEKMLQDDLTGYAALTDDDLTALEQLLRYILRMHVSRRPLVQDTDLEAEIEKLRLFKRDPISFAKQETDNKIPGDEDS